MYLCPHAIVPAGFNYIFHFITGALQFYCVNRILGEAESFASGFNRDLQLLSKLKEVTGAEVFLTHSDQKLTTKTFLAQFQIADHVRKSLSFKLFRKYLEASESKYHQPLNFVP